MRKVVKVKTLSGTPYMISEEPDDLIGKGSYAKVVRAYNRNEPGKKCVAKIFQLNNLKQHRSGLEELRVISKLPRNQHLVNYEKIKLASKNYIYIIMEYCQGGTLTNFINKIAIIPEADIWKFIGDFLFGYKCLYQNNIVHRDIKTDNILIQNGQFKIADFGLAKILQQKSKTLSAKGSPVFMAPDLFKKGEATSKIDAYSLGVTIYYMAFQKYPYTSKTKYMSLEQLFSDISNSQLIIPPGRSSTLNNILKRLLEKNPDRRISWPDIFTQYQYLEQTGLTISFSELNISNLLETVQLKAIKNSDTQMRQLELLDLDLMTSLKPQSVVFLTELEKTLLSKRVIQVFMDRVKGKLKQLETDPIIKKFNELVTGFNWIILNDMDSQFHGTLNYLNQKDQQLLVDSKNFKYVAKLIRQDKSQIQSQLESYGISKIDISDKQIKLKLYDCCSKVLEILIKKGCFKTAVYVQQVEKLINQDPEAILIKVQRNVDCVDDFINWIEVSSGEQQWKEILSQNYKFLLM